MNPAIFYIAAIIVGLIIFVVVMEGDKRARKKNRK